MTKCKKGYFVVWTPVGEPFVEIIEFDNDYWKKVLSNLTIFFKSYVVKHLLGHVELHFCPICDKLCLPPPEVDPKKVKKEESAFCSTCEQHYHVYCLGENVVIQDYYTCPGCE